MRRSSRVLVLGALALGGCSIVTPFAVGPAPDGGGGPVVDADTSVDGDEPPGDSGADGAADAETDGDMEGIWWSGPGPLTFVLEHVEALTEPLYDLDGDGDLDNSIGDLSAVDADFLAMALGGMFDSQISQGTRQLVHLPWVEDRAAAESLGATVIVAGGRDTDPDRDITDDFSGVEPYTVGDLDPCGEPLSFFVDVAIEEGAFELFGGDETSIAAVRSDVHMRRPSGTAVIAPGGATMSFTASGALVARELGTAASLLETADLNNLEVLLAGGLALGIPRFPGLAPDLDLDGDGLERFITDPDGHIVHCVDGDGTVVEGRDCWDDDGFADAFSIVFRWDLVSATFAGRRPGWEDDAEGECTDPPAESLFGPAFTLP